MAIQEMREIDSRFRKSLIRQYYFADLEYPAVETHPDQEPAKVQ